MSLIGELNNLEKQVFENDKVSFKPLQTEDDLIFACYDCNITDEQKEFVNPAWFSIGRAYLRPNDYCPFIIYNKDGKPIGFISFSEWLAGGKAYTWSFFVDKRYQKMGFGRSSAQLAVKILKTANPNKQIKLATEKTNLSAQRLYISLGFKVLDELDGTDMVFGL